MCFQQFTVHDDYIKDISIISIFDDPSMIQNRMTGAVFLNKVELYIIIGTGFSGRDLFPDAFSYRLPLVRADQVPEAVAGIGKKLIDILTAGILDHLQGQPYKSGRHREDSGKYP